MKRLVLWLDSDKKFLVLNLTMKDIYEETEEHKQKLIESTQWRNEFHAILNNQSVEVQECYAEMKGHFLEADEWWGA